MLGGAGPAVATIVGRAHQIKTPRPPVDWCRKNLVAAGKVRHQSFNIGCRQCPNAFQNPHPAELVYKAVEETTRGPRRPGGAVAVRANEVFMASNRRDLPAPTFDLEKIAAAVPAADQGGARTTGPPVPASPS